MKIYHTETQADYDALMVELEAEGCVCWATGRKMTESKDWTDRKENTCVSISNKRATRGSIIFFKVEYPHVPITKYKAKVDEKMRFTKENVERVFDKFMQGGDSVADLKRKILKLVKEPEKVVVPKFVAEWIESKKNLNIWKMIDDLRNGNFLENPVINWLIEEYSKYGLSDQFDLLSLIKIYGYTIEPEQLYYIPLPYLETSDGIQQVLSQRKGDKNYFACRPAETLKQRFTKEELEQAPEIYKPFAKLIEEEAND